MLQLSDFPGFQLKHFGGDAMMDCVVPRLKINGMGWSRRPTSYLGFFLISLDHVGRWTYTN